VEDAAGLRVHVRDRCAVPAAVDLDRVARARERRELLVAKVRAAADRVLVRVLRQMVRRHFDLFERVLPVLAPRRFLRHAAADVRDAVEAAFRAGAEGVILSRKYSEMRLANLSAAGEGLR
jgi:hypothetical protein